MCADPPGEGYGIIVYGNLYLVRNPVVANQIRRLLYHISLNLKTWRWLS